jgi:rhodanese-related sulfurtransferase
MSDRGSSVEQVSPRGLSSWLDEGRPLAVLDVREPWERAHCAIAVPASASDIHISMGLVTTRLEAIRAVCAGRTLVVYCHHGVRSMMVAEWLTSQGIGPVRNLEGGIHAWSMEVDPSLRRY